MRSQSLLLLALALVTGTTACGSTDSEQGTDEGATRIDPVGTDLPGKLVVKLPAGQVEATTVMWNTKSLPPGQTFDQVPVGVQSVSMKSASITGRASATVTAGQTTTVQASLLGIDAVTGPRTLGLKNDKTDWGIRVGIPHGSSLGGIAPATDLSKSLAVFAGTYEVNFGVGSMDGVAVTLAGGDSKKVVLTETSTRRVTRIKAPARELPTADCYGSAADAFTISYSNTASTFVLGNNEAIDVGLAPSKDDNASYELQSASWHRSFRLPKPARGEGPLAFAIGRVDVSDVLINSTLPRVPGTYRIFKATAQDQASTEEVLRCAPKTNTGVDLPPGRYVVKVSYQTVEAGTKIDAHLVTVP